MKFLESSFIDYIENVNYYNLHEKEKVISHIPKDINNFKNLIIYGPSGIGKYSQTLNILKHFSNSNMKHESDLIFYLIKSIIITLKLVIFILRLICSYWVVMQRHYGKTYTII